MVPNKERTLIKFDDCLWQTLKIASQLGHNLPLMLGKSVTGETLCLDLLEQPHLLIAGSTGAGKSVFLSELISCLALAKTSAEFKFILVDTKQLDLTFFNCLEHAIEMVDKIEDLYDVLHMLKKEVRLRTELMKGLARNITEYNKLGYEQKPYYILIIDELADVIGQDKELAKSEDKDSEKEPELATLLKDWHKSLELLESTLLQLRNDLRLKLLTETSKQISPREYVLNSPLERDSRVVLDEGGAEFLLGKGDFLYRTAQTSEVKRGHGAFVTMEDIARVISEHDRIRETFERSFNYAKT